MVLVFALNVSLSNSDASPLAKSSFKRLRVCLSSPSVDVSFTGGIGVYELEPEAKLEAACDEEAVDDCNVNSRGGGGGRNSNG